MSITGKPIYHSPRENLEKQQELLSMPDPATRVVREYAFMDHTPSLPLDWEDLQARVAKLVESRIPVNRYYVSDSYELQRLVLQDELTLSDDNYAVEKMLLRISGEYIKEVSSSLYQLLKRCRNGKDFSLIEKCPEFDVIHKRCKEFDSLALEVRKRAYAKEKSREDSISRRLHAREREQHFWNVVVVISIIVTLIILSCSQR